MSRSIFAAFLIAIASNCFAGNIDFSMNRPEKVEKKLTVGKYINLYGPIIQGNKALEELKKIHGPGRTYMRINSPGGLVTVSKDIMAEIVRLKSERRNVVCVADKMAASGAALIFMTCSKRYAKPDTEILFHGARYFIFMGVITEANSKEAAEGLTKTNEELAQAMVQYAGFTYEVARAITASANDTIYTGSYAYKVNFIDKLFGELKFKPRLTSIEELEGNSNS